MTLLGDFTLSIDGELVTTWPRPAARRLVSLLVISPGARAPRWKLAEALFPGAEPRAGLRALSKAASQARVVLGTDRLVSQGQHLVLDAVIDSDLERLRTEIEGALVCSPEERIGRLAAALAKAGPVLAEEPEHDLVASVRGDLDARVRSARFARSADLEYLNGSTEGWEEAFSANPADEEVASRLVRAARRLGDEGRAATVYRSCRLALAHTGSPGVSAALLEAAEGLIVEPSENDHGAALVGRRQELGAILSAVTSAELDAGRALVLTGTTGVGKTALLLSVSAALRQRGWRVGFATAAVGDELVAFAALREAVSSIVAGSEIVLPGPVRALLHPSNRKSPKRWPLPVLASELAGLLDRVCVLSPGVLVLDDVHRCDSATLAVVGRLSAPGLSRPWSILLGMRSDDPKSPAPTFPAQVRVMVVEPLEKSAASELARRHLGTSEQLSHRREELVEQIATWSRGNPFFCQELARHVARGERLPVSGQQGSLPERIVQLLERRLETCSPGARAVMPLVALVGTGAELSVVAALLERLGSGRSDVAGVIDELVGAGLVVVVGKSVRLTHPLWREAVLSRLNPVRVAELHVHIADALEEASGREQVSAGHRIAAFRLTGLPEHAATAARSAFKAGHGARSVLADDVALELFRAGLAAFESVPASRRRHLRAAACAGWLELGEILSDRLILDEAAEAFRASAALAGCDDEVASTRSALGGIAYKRGDLTTAGSMYRQGLKMLTSSGPWARARLGADLGWALYRQGDVASGLAELQAAAAGFANTRDASATARCLDLLSMVLLASGDALEARRASDEAMALSYRLDDPRLTPALATHRAALLMSTGALDEAKRESARAVESARRAGDRYVESVAVWGLADILDRLGDLDGALAARREEGAVLLELGNAVNHAVCLAHQASLLSRLGKSAEAAVLARQARAVAERSGLSRVGADVDSVIDSVIGSVGNTSGTPPL